MTKYCSDANYDRNEKNIYTGRNMYFAIFSFCIVYGGYLQSPKFITYVRPTWFRFYVFLATFAEFECLPQCSHRFFLHHVVKTIRHADLYFSSVVWVFFFPHSQCVSDAITFYGLDSLTLYYVTRFCFAVAKILRK